MAYFLLLIDSYFTPFYLNKIFLPFFLLFKCSHYLLLLKIFSLNYDKLNYIKLYFINYNNYSLSFIKRLIISYFLLK